MTKILSYIVLSDKVYYIEISLETVIINKNKRIQ